MESFDLYQDLFIGVSACLGTLQADSHPLADVLWEHRISCLGNMA